MRNPEDTESPDDSLGTEYLRHLTEVGSRRTVTATEDIYSTREVKLLSAGYAVNRALLEKLLNQKLLKPIDQSCVVDDAIDGRTLAARAAELLQTQQSFAALVESRWRGDFLDACFGRIQIPSAIRNKLTVLQEQAPMLLDHSLWCAMVSVLLGQKIGMDRMALHNLSIAALLHDIGQLHIDHRILNPSERLDDSLRRQVQSHPLIGGSIISALGTYDESVARAVFEHHERVDGSGYPAGLLGSQISLMGRLLSFVEFSIGIVQSAGARHLAIVVRTYAHQFDPIVIRGFWEYFNMMKAPDDYPFDTREIPDLYARLSSILEGWEAVQEDASSPCWELARRDFRAIRTAFSSVGIARDLIEDLTRTEADSEDHVEACSVLREGLRQAREVTQILTKRARDQPTMQEDTRALAWLETTKQALDVE